MVACYLDKIVLYQKVIYQFPVWEREVCRSMSGWQHKHPDMGDRNYRLLRYLLLTESAQLKVSGST